MNNYLTNSNQFYFFVKKTYECKRIFIVAIAMYTRNKSALCEYFYGISHVVKSNNFTHDYTRKDARFLRAQIGFAEKQLFAVLSVQCGVVVQWLDRQTTDGIAMPIAEPNVVGLTLSTRTHCQCGVTVRQVESCDFASMF